MLGTFSFCWRQRREIKVAFVSSFPYVSQIPPALEGGRREAITKSGRWASDVGQIPPALEGGRREAIISPDCERLTGVISGG